MTSASLPIYGLLRSLIKWLPNWYLRRRYTAERLAQLIYFDFVPRCESTWINVAGAPDIRLALQVINLSPFSVVLDRAQFRLSCAGAMVSLSSLERRSIASGELVQLHLHESLGDGHASLIANAAEPLQAWLDGNLEFNCSVRHFGKRLTSLTGVQVTLVNAHTRRSALPGIQPLASIAHMSSAAQIAKP